MGLWEEALLLPLRRGGARGGVALGAGELLQADRAGGRAACVCVWRAGGGGGC